MSWNLASMRGDMNADDPLGGLGPRVEPTPPPAPAPVSRGDGFLVHPDGTLSTEIEPPSGPPPAPAPADPDDDYPPVAAPIPADAPPWPFPQGAMWRHLHTGLFYRWHDGRAECRAEHEYAWRGSCVTERDKFDVREVFEPIASAPAPLKVGDKVRVCPSGMGNYYAGGEVLTVAKIAGDGRFWTADDPTEPFGHIDGGIYWERA